MTKLSELLTAAREADGRDPFNESTRTAIADGARLRVFEFDEVVAAAASGSEPVEFVVHPRYRRQGRGRALLDALIARDETEFWAHGDLPGARALAASAGLTAVRTLLVLRQSARPSARPTPDDITIRPFAQSDVDSIIAINAAAFASHPEQGAMDHADFERRRALDWFDPAGLFVAERDGEVVGFHWTKRERDGDGTLGGEVYVVGVVPHAHGGGLGTALTDAGIQFLWDAGVSHIDLYVEGDNDAALVVYRKLGFVEHDRDVLYAFPRPGRA